MSIGVWGYTTKRLCQLFKKSASFDQEADQLNPGKFRVPLKVEPHADAYQMLLQIDIEGSHKLLMHGISHGK